MTSGYLGVAGDIADAGTARRAVDQARDRFGRVDTLINNAGIYIGKPFTRVHARGLRRDHGREPDRLLPHHPAGDRTRWSSRAAGTS
jgi:NAD(P)-dependent dehydrogenase (short-subunit alcohol dehydrogenase family)